MIVIHGTARSVYGNAVRGLAVVEVVVTLSVAEAFAAAPDRPVVARVAILLTVAAMNVVRPARNVAAANVAILMTVAVMSVVRPARNVVVANAAILTTAAMTNVVLISVVLMDTAHLNAGQQILFSEAQIPVRLAVAVVVPGRLARYQTIRFVHLLQQDNPDIAVAKRF